MTQGAPVSPRRGCSVDQSRDAAKSQGCVFLIYGVLGSLIWLHERHLDAVYQRPAMGVTPLDLIFGALLGVGAARLGGTERWLLNLEGEIEVKVGDQNYRISKEGTLYFKASLPHQFLNPGKSMARCALVTTPVVL